MNKRKREREREKETARGKRRRGSTVGEKLLNDTDVKIVYCDWLVSTKFTLIEENVTNR